MRVSNHNQTCILFSRSFLRVVARSRRPHCIFEFYSETRHNASFTLLPTHSSSPWHMCVVRLSKTLSGSQAALGVVFARISVWTPWLLAWVGSAQFWKLWKQAFFKFANNRPDVPAIVESAGNLSFLGLFARHQKKATVSCKARPREICIKVHCVHDTRTRGPTSQRLCF